ncbi:hypothetical protein FIBSPDRAFT_276172 [Athelia psychrophila]|uniref:Heme haloperoxidase family profile domain-containing protein n=1 Tax=Athelia psychrophila TaxID=1759441 RepID=A0A166REU8_9AGAM|nr:hypothetical protein FIBSPDRAFT_276172 [Fibularhizoctonia sp. CBS 109695]
MIVHNHLHGTFPVNGTLNQYYPPQSGDVRALCPMLNALLNRGYLRVPVPSPSPSIPFLLLPTFLIPCPFLFSLFAVVASRSPRFPSAFLSYPPFCRIIPIHDTNPSSSSTTDPTTANSAPSPPFCVPSPASRVVLLPRPLPSSLLADLAALVRYCAT